MHGAEAIQEDEPLDGQPHNVHLRPYSGSQGVGDNQQREEDSLPETFNPYPDAQLITEVGVQTRISMRTVLHMMGLGKGRSSSILNSSD